MPMIWFTGTRGEWMGIEINNVNRNRKTYCRYARSFSNVYVPTAYSCASNLNLVLFKGVS